MNEHKEYLTKYIQSLPDEALDRIVEAQDWCSGTFVDTFDGSRCLVGHAEDWWWDGNTGTFGADSKDIRPDYFDEAWKSFDFLCRATRSPIPIDNPAVQFVKQVAAEEIEKRADTVIADANLPGVAEPVEVAACIYIHHELRLPLP